MDPTILRRAIVCALSAAALAACAGGDKVWMRSGSTSSDHEIDKMSCAEQSEAGASVTIGAGTAAPATDRFSNRYGCLRERGYKLVQLTPEETQRLKSLSGVAREEYWSELMRARGFTPPSALPAPIAQPAPAVAPSRPLPPPTR